MRLLSLFSVALASAAISIAADWVIATAPSNSFVLSVEKTGVMSGKKHVLAWPNVTGKLQYEPTKPLETKLELRVPAGQLQVQDTWVSEKDRKKILEFALGNEVLDATKNKEIVFTSTSVKAGAKADEFVVSGQLSLRGMAKPVEVMVQRKGPALFSGEARFAMTFFGIKPPKALLGAIGTKDEMLLTFVLSAEPKGAGAK